MKSVLALRTYSYPDGATATRRFESFCRYSQEAGHDVTLLALAPTSSDMVGRRCLDPACRFKVIQEPFPECRSELWARIERRLSRTLFPEMQYSRAANQAIEKAAGELLRQRRFDCMLTTYPCLGSLMVVDRLSRQYGTPWIADLRDIPDEIDVGRRHWITRRSVSLLERACASAAHILTVSNPLSERLRSEYRLRVPVTTIYNGYEEDDLLASGANVCSGEFQITYCGSFGYGRDLSLLLQALDRLGERGVDLQDVVIDLYGVNDLTGLSVGCWRSAARIRCHGVVAHAKSIEAQKGSAILLSLASPHSRGIMTSKIFEFAMIGRPVLSIPADRDVLDHFVSRSGIGLASGDVDSIATFIDGHIQAWRKTGILPTTTPDQEYINGFSRRAQAAKLIEIIRSI